LYAPTLLRGPGFLIYETFCKLRVLLLAFYSGRFYSKNAIQFWMLDY
jgi:hypothetical protein